VVARRRRELRELAERIRALPPEETGAVGRVFLAYVGVQVVLDLAVVVVGARAARRLVRARRSGLPLDPTTAWRSPLVALLVLHRVGRLVSRFLLVRWLRRQLPSTPGSP
jgi:hypothetical protein